MILDYLSPSCAKRAFEVIPQRVCPRGPPSNQQPIEHINSPLSPECASRHLKHPMLLLLFKNGRFRPTTATTTRPPPSTASRASGSPQGLRTEVQRYMKILETTGRSAIHCKLLSFSQRTQADCPRHTRGRSTQSHHAERFSRKVPSSPPLMW